MSYIQASIVIHHSAVIYTILCVHLGTLCVIDKTIYWMNCPQLLVNQGEHTIQFLNTYLVQWIDTPAVCIPLPSLLCPMPHHQLSPTSDWNTLLVFPPTLCLHQPAGYLHPCMRLWIKRGIPSTLSHSQIIFRIFMLTYLADIGHLHHWNEYSCLRPAYGYSWSVWTLIHHS